MNLTTYNAACNLQATSKNLRARYFKSRLGGRIIAGEAAPCYHDESLWTAHLHGIIAEGTTCDDTLENWIRKALAATPRRATDHRPICPYNGQLPASPPTAALP